MIKLALQLAGEFRTFEQNFPYLKKNIIDKFDTDLYFYGYPNKNGIKNNIEILENYKDIKKQYKFVEYTEELKQILLNKSGAYNFHTRKRQETKVENVISLFWNKYQVNELRKQQQIDYDYVITTRTDLLVNCELPNNIFNKLNNNTIAIPSGMDYKFINPNAVSDNFALGTPEVMNQYSDAFFNFFELFIKNNNALFHPESFCGLNIHQIHNLNRIECCKLNPKRNNIYAAILE